MIELQNVCKSFDGVSAVNDVSLKVQPGRIMGFLGPNGAGKTTTLRIIMNILQPDTGKILFGGSDQRPATSKVGYLPEERGLYQKISVQETIRYFARLRGLHQPDQRCEEYLERFELAERAQAKVQELSKGNQQKLQFINTIIHDPHYIVLDEPLSGLDPVNQLVFKEILTELKVQGKTIIFSSHQMDQVEKLCDDVALVNKGNLILSGSLAEIRATHGQMTIEVIPSNAGDLDHDLFRELGGKRIDSRILIPMEDISQKQSLFTRLNENMDIKSLRQAEPGLEEIFINTVRGGVA